MSSSLAFILIIQLMRLHSVKEYEQNEQDMLTLFRKLSWREQLMLIGRMEFATEQNVCAENKIVLFPCAVRND